MAKTKTSFKAGESKGRPKGTPNKLTKTVKEVLLDVFNQIQLDPKVNLLSFAKQYPRDFYQIAAKLIPTEVKQEVKVHDLPILNITFETDSISDESTDSLIDEQ